MREKGVLFEEFLRPVEGSTGVNASRTRRRRRVVRVRFVGQDRKVARGQRGGQEVRGKTALCMQVVVIRATRCDTCSMVLNR